MKKHHHEKRVNHFVTTTISLAGDTEGKKTMPVFPITRNNPLLAKRGQSPPLKRVAFITDACILIPLSASHHHFPHPFTTPRLYADHYNSFSQLTSTSMPTISVTPIFMAPRARVVAFMGVTKAVAADRRERKTRARILM